MLLILAFLCVAGAVLVAVEMIMQPSRQRDATLKRVRTYGLSPSARERRTVQDRLADRYGQGLARVALRLDPRLTTDRVGTRLVSAGMARRWTPTSFLASKIVLACAGVIAGGLLGAVLNHLDWAVFWVVGLGVLGFFYPDLVVRSRIRSRRETMRREMPDALDILAVSVEAGLGFDQALSRLGDYTSGPLIEEFQLVLNEMRVGETRGNALRRMAERVDIPELNAFVHAMLQADQLGTPLGKILRIQASEVRKKRQVAAEERAMKAPIKMLPPTAFLIFPAMFVVLLGPAFLTITKALG